MAKIAFIGLGQMGAPMARRLLEAEHDVTVWNRTASKAEPLTEAGARAASTPADAAAGAEAVFTMVADPAALEEVVFGADGVAEAMADGATLIEMSTVGPDTIIEVGDRLPEGVEIVDAPVLGTVPQATDGSLKIFVGASDELFERWRPVLEAMGTPYHLGPRGAGAAMKLVANSTLGALQATLGEALALADALGLPEDAVLDLLAGSAIGVTVKGKRRFIESGEYPPNFKLRLAAKDIRLVVEAAERRGFRPRVAPAVREWFEEAAADFGDLDYSAVVAHVRGRPAHGP
ncbi:MAG TPA: NAD(P)-dependent oxidoreductase [Acidimicrobiales bacterium]|nr:NAD(P)-dependent oxidoreductase [Acidimicrobiales bacterium]